MEYTSVFMFALLSLMLMFSEKRIFQETIIYFSKMGVQIPGDYKDFLLLWKELSSVVVREDFITIFQQKDKYFQFQVMQDLSTLELAKLNAFCLEQIEQAQAYLHENK